jgi:adenine phosphoribosyltransferase
MTAETGADTGTIAADSDPRVKSVLAAIRGIPDFPKKGIYFYDITTLLLNTEAFHNVVDMLVERYEGRNVEAVAGFEARGFIFGPPLALRLNVPFVPLRKPGKLPGKTLKASYDLEYGSDAIEVHADAITEGQRVVLVDDLIATGGTLAAGVKLMDQLKAEVVEAVAILELQELEGRKKLPNTPLHALAVVSEYGPGGLEGNASH